MHNEHNEHNEHNQHNQHNQRRQNGHDRQDAHADGGQSAVMVLIVAAALGAALLLALVDFGGIVQDRARAQTAADAAALASLNGGRTAADELAQRHGGVVVSWIEGPGEFEVTVVVRIGESSATARASQAP